MMIQEKLSKADALDKAGISKSMFSRWKKKEDMLRSGGVKKKGKTLHYKLTS